MKFPCCAEMPSPKMADNDLGIPWYEGSQQLLLAGLEKTSTEERTVGGGVTMNSIQAWKPDQSTLGKPSLCHVLAAWPLVTEALPCESQLLSLQNKETNIYLPSLYRIIKIESFWYTESTQCTFIAFSLFLASQNKKQSNNRKQENKKKEPSTALVILVPTPTHHH